MPFLRPIKRQRLQSEPPPRDLEGKADTGSEREIRSPGRMRRASRRWGPRGEMRSCWRPAWASATVRMSWVPGTLPMAGFSGEDPRRVPAPPATGGGDGVKTPRASPKHRPALPGEAARRVPLQPRPTQEKGPLAASDPDFPLTLSRITDKQ